MIRLMNLLLVEDDKKESAKFKNLVDFKFRNHINFVAITGSSMEGIKVVREQQIGAIILDMELHWGEGSGIEFLKGIVSADPKPIIFVTTHTPSSMVYNMVRDLGVDFIFYKRQKGYMPEAVLSSIFELWQANFDATEGSQELPALLINEEDIEKKIIENIEYELDAIGITSRYKGREYIAEAILLLVKKDSKTYKAVLNQVAQSAKISYSSVIRAIQTAIQKTWYSTKKEHLLKHYTAPIDMRTEIPSPTEFIHFYAEKIKKSL